MVLKVGIDFDNTIADYSKAFFQVAVQQGWLPEGEVLNKQQVKQYFISRNLPDRWTELQGIVYGEKIANATVYSGVKAQIKRLLALSAELYIISHKTHYPVIGEKISLHQCALSWLIHHDLVGHCAGQIKAGNVYFNQTQEDKINKIAMLSCDYFIDDLPAIFQHKNFPAKVKSIYFAPHKQGNDQTKTHFKVSHWSKISQIIC